MATNTNNHRSNYFLVEYFDWPEQVAKPGRRARLVNRLLGKLGVSSRLEPLPSIQMTSVDKRVNLFHLVSQVIAYDVPGAIVELGCNKGESSVLIQTILSQSASDREFHVYDSFEGLPAAAVPDGNTPFAESGLKATEEQLRINFRRYGLREPVIHAGWFDKTLPDTLPDQIAFAYLDGDFYDSILVSLQHVYPRLAKGAICLIDDYCDPEVHKDWNLLPGVKKACDEYLADKPERVNQLFARVYPHGFFRKQ